jgi:hypothetical protein
MFQSFKNKPWGLGHSSSGRVLLTTVQYPILQTKSLELAGNSAASPFPTPCLCNLMLQTQQFTASLSEVHTQPRFLRVGIRESQSLLEERGTSL